MSDPAPLAAPGSPTHKSQDGLPRSTPLAAYLRAALGADCVLATVRTRLRASEFGITALAIGVGVLAGLCVAVMTTVVNAAHVRIYGVPFDVHLSAAERIAPLAAFGAPMLGGFCSGRSTSGLLAGRGRPQSIRLKPTLYVADACHSGRGFLSPRKP